MDTESGVVALLDPLQDGLSPEKWQECKKTEKNRDKHFKHTTKLIIHEMSKVMIN